MSSVGGKVIQIYGRRAAQIIAAVQAERLMHILRAPSFYSHPIDYCNMQHHSSPLSNECALAGKLIFTDVCAALLALLLYGEKCSAHPSKRTYNVRGN